MLPVLFLGKVARRLIDRASPRPGARAFSGLAVLILACFLTAGGRSALAGESAPAPADSSSARQDSLLLQQAENLLLEKGETVEGRVQVEGRLQDLRGRLYHLSGYHALCGRLYESMGRYDQARRAYEMAVARDSTNACLRVRAAEMYLRTIKTGYDPLDLDRAMRVIRPATRSGADPRSTAEQTVCSHRALAVASMLLSLQRSAADVAPGDATAMAQEGYDCTSRLVASVTRSAEFWRLHAVNCLDLGRLEEAQRAFKLSFDCLSPEEQTEVRPFFLAPEALRSRPEFLALSPEEKYREMLRYWDAHNPAPLEPINEAQLQYWKRVTVAMIYESRPWDSDVGRALIALGPPVSASSFDRPNGSGLFRDLGLRLRFADGTVLTGMRMHPSLPIRFVPQSRAAYQWLIAGGQPFAQAVRPGAARAPLQLSAEMMKDLVGEQPDGSHLSLLRVLLSVPTKKEATLTGATVRCQIKDTAERVVAYQDRELSAAEDDFQATLYPADAPGQRFLLAALDFRDLPPGHYRTEVTLLAGGGEVLGAGTVPTEVRSLDGPLCVSGLEPFVNQSQRPHESVFAHRHYLPTTAVVRAGSSLRFFYTVQGLEAAEGSLRFNTTQIILSLGEYRRQIEAIAREAARSGLTWKEVDLASRLELSNQGMQVTPNGSASGSNPAPMISFPREYSVPVGLNPREPVRAETVVPTDNLAPGEYVLVIGVRDRNRGELPASTNSPPGLARPASSAYGARLFRVVSDDAFDQFLGQGL